MNKLMFFLFLNVMFITIYGCSNNPEKVETIEDSTTANIESTLNKYKPFTLITIYSSTLKTEYCYLHDDNHQVEGYVQLEISNGLMILTLESGKQVTINLYNIQYFTYKNQSGAKMLEFYM